MIKISFDAKRLFCNFTGLGNYSRTLVGNLQRLYSDDTYTLYTPKTKKNTETEYFFEKDKFDIITPSKGGVKGLWRSWGVLKNIKRDKPDIYHGLSHDLPFSVTEKTKGNTRYVVTMHDVCYKTFPGMFTAIDRFTYNLKCKHSVKVADAIVAISESTKRDIIKYFPSVDESKIHTIYQALNPVYYDEIDIENAKSIIAKYGIKGDYLIYVGSINSRKNLLGVVKAYKLLPEDKRLPLIIIGGGRGYKNEIIEYAKENDIYKYLTFLSNINSSEELQAFYSLAKALVYPSFYEGFGLPVAESLLCSTPVITSSISSLPEAGGDGALYVDPNSIEEIADAIEKIISNPDLAAELADKGKKYVLEKFNSDQLTTQMNNLYKSLL